MILQTRSENMWRKTETRKMTEVNHFVYEADLENRGIRITKYTGNADCVQIPAEIDGAPVVSLGPYVFVEIADAGKGTFKAVVATNGDTTPREIFLPETLRYISYCAFYGCENIICIEIPAAVTEIGSSAFAFCKSLQHICLPSGLQILNRSMFRNCSSLQKVHISGNVKTIGFIAFENCTSLESVILPDSVSEIEMRAFCGCKSLRQIRLPNHAVVFGNGAFAESGLVEMHIPETACLAEAMFHNCKELEQIVVEKRLTEIQSDAFSGCESLEKVLFPEGVRKVGSRAFFGCEMLERLSPIDADASYGDDVWNGTPFY